MENYYKILEVDQEASQEIIEKVYKIFVKKYHPDLQSDEDKATAEEKIKKINEAYDVLSDKDKRAEYDKQLVVDTVPAEEYNILLTENTTLKSQLESVQDLLKELKSNISNAYKTEDTNDNLNFSSSFSSNQNNSNFNETTHNNYNTINNTQYYSQPKKKPTHYYRRSPIKSFFKNIISIGITIFIMYSLYKIPSVADYINSLLIFKN